MTTITTRIHAFWFDLHVPEQKAEWEKLRRRMKKEGVHAMHSWNIAGNSYYLSWARPADSRQPLEMGREIELETQHLFSNQWNTAPIEGISESGMRVFDFAYDYMVEPGMKHLRRGHYLDQTFEMKELRESVQICGYCGAKYGSPLWPHPSRQAIPEDGFCHTCLGNEYLKAEDLYLLRLLPVAGHLPQREKLTEEELAGLLPEYQVKQEAASAVRIKAKIERSLADAEKKVRQAETERDALLWCLEHNLLRLEENMIFYPHTGRFCFGWREPLKGDDLSLLLDHISEFSWPYDIKCADGRKLSGN